MRFEGEFIDEKGKKVDWWFNAESEDALRKHCAEKGWEVLYLESEAEYKKYEHELKPIFKRKDICILLGFIGMLYSCVVFYFNDQKITNIPIPTILFFAVPFAYAYYLNLMSFCPRCKKPLWLSLWFAGEQTFNYKKRCRHCKLRLVPMRSTKYKT